MLYKKAEYNIAYQSINRPLAFVYCTDHFLQSNCKYFEHGGYKVHEAKESLSFVVLMHGRVFDLTLQRNTKDNDKI